MPNTISDKPTESLGQDLLGKGYNPFGDFASSKGTRYNVFNWANVPTKQVPDRDARIPVHMEFQSVEESALSTIFGQTITDYQKRVSSSLNLGITGAFSGSISSDFSKESTTHSDYAFTRIQESVSKWTLILNVNNESRKYLDPEFVKALGALSNTPQALESFFNAYGSHVLTGVVFGGSAIYSVATDIVKYGSSSSVEASAEGAYKAITGGASGSVQNQYSSFMSASVVQSKTRGGVATLGADAFSLRDKLNPATGNLDAYKAWHDSINNPGGAVLIDLTPNNGLLPIWELADTPEKQAYMKDYVVNVWAIKQAAVYRPDVINDLQVIGGGDRVPQGYQVISKDLNRGVGGAVLYLCARKSQPDLVNGVPQCVTDIKVLFGKNAPAPAGYRRIDVDLNKGAGGNFIYLAYKSEAYDFSKAIFDVDIVIGENAPVPKGFYALRGHDNDLNRGAGGNIIYVCYKNADSLRALQ